MKSMTAYARVEGTLSELPYVLELKSVNHRFLDIHLHVPPHFFAFEVKIHNIVKERFCRGKVDVWVRPARLSTLNLGVDGLSKEEIIAQARDIGAFLRELKEAGGFSGEPELSHLLQFKGFLSTPVLGAGDTEKNWPELTKLLDLLLDEADTFRKREGTFLCRELEKMAAALKSQVAHVATLSPELLLHYRTRLSQRLAALMPENTPLNPANLDAELAVFAERCDIAEELTRLACHLDRWSDHLKEDGAVGRKLDFLLQEMNREVNTIGSKGNYAPISQMVVDCKLALEKMREQVQNIE